MIFWNPSGSLNVAQDPSDLPETVGEYTITSGAMVRCKNLRLDQKGIAKTRDGSAKLNATQVGAPIWWIEEQAGVRYSFAGTSICRDESIIVSSLTSAQWSAIKYNAFNDTTQNVFALNGTDRKRIQESTAYEWGIAAPTVAPTLNNGHGGGLTGLYNAKYTYVRKVGATVVSESDPSPAGTAQNLTGQSLSAVITQPTDPQVTHIRFYRTVSGGGTYFYDQEIAINLIYEYAYTYGWELADAYEAGDGYKFTTADSTHATENTFAWEYLASEYTATITAPVYSQPFDTIDSVVADGSLGDSVETDHDRPPLGSFVFGPAYDGTCFIIKDNLLYYCKPKQPEYWPPTYFIEVSVPQLPGITGVFHNGQAYYFSKSEVYYIQGTGHGTFFPLPMRAKTGAQSIRGAIAVAGKGIFHTGPDGIYLFASGSDVKITEDALEPLFRGEDVQGMPGVADMTSAIIWAYRNHLYFAYRSANQDYASNVLVMNMDTSRVNYYVYNDGSDVEISSVTTDHQNSRLLIGDGVGFVRVIESNSYTDDSGEEIEFEVQSKDFVLQTRLHFPRWMKYDIDASNAEECTGALLLGGEVHHSHILTENRNTRRRLVGEGNGNRAAIRIYGRGQVSIFACESE